jgi:metal-responsive CopG/Arc/MetJ family transcriptional regulator
MRTHVVLPEDLIADVDSIVGKRKRSRFIEEAVRQSVRRAKLRMALEQARGIIDLDDHPEWSTPEKISAWVREQRAIERDPWEGR